MPASVASSSGWEGYAWRGTLLPGNSASLAAHASTASPSLSSGFFGESARSRPRPSLRTRQHGVSGDACTRRSLSSFSLALSRVVGVDALRVHGWPRKGGMWHLIVRPRRQEGKERKQRKEMVPRILSSLRLPFRSTSPTQVGCSRNHSGPKAATGELGASIWAKVPLALAHDITLDGVLLGSQPVQDSGQLRSGLEPPRRRQRARQRQALSQLGPLVSTVAGLTSLAEN